MSKYLIHGNAPFDDPKHWHQRGYLPHYIESHSYQFITYRLADSLPQKLLKKIPENASPKEVSHHRQAMDQQLDKGYGSCLLKDYAPLIIDTWRHFEGIDYQIVAASVMPNHIHILIVLNGNRSLSKIIHSWKSYTSHEILKLIAQQQKKEIGEHLWQAGYWDRFIRDERHFNNTVDYILQNPVKAGLVKQIDQWPWSIFPK